MKLENPFITANKNLTKKINKFEKENEELFYLREQKIRDLKTIDGLVERFRRQNQVRVEGQKENDDIVYVLQILKSDYTDKGIRITVRI